MLKVQLDLYHAFHMKVVREISILLPTFFSIRKTILKIWSYKFVIGQPDTVTIRSIERYRFLNNMLATLECAWASIISANTQ